MARRPRDQVEREIMDIIPERFDADSDSQGARRGAHTRWILSIALGLLALAAVGVAARHVLVGDKGQVSADANIPDIKPDDKPIKTKPEDRGGMDVPNQDKLVYQDVGKGDSQAQSEKLMPPAEKPQSPVPKPNSAAAPAEQTASSALPAAPPMPPTPPSAAKSAATTKPASAAGAMPTAPVASAPTAPAAAMSATQSQAQAQVQTQIQAQAKAQAGAQAQAVAAASASKKESAAAPTVVASAAAPAPSAPAKPTVVSSSAATSAPVPAAGAGGGWQIQLAAMRSEAEAQAVWKKVLGNNQDLLGNLTEDIQRADLGAKGIYFRLRAGPLDEAAAKSLCAELIKRNQVCLVARK